MDCDLLIAKAVQNMNTPRVHGNGFIQLDISPRVRLHIWGHPDIPRQKVETPIHDHKFAFSSVILKGTLINVEYSVTYVDPADLRHTPTHAVFCARRNPPPNEDTQLVDVGHRVIIRQFDRQRLTTGEGYSMEVDQVHESIPHGIAASLIVKRGKTLHEGGPEPRVFVPLGKRPDNEFNRYSIPPKELWHIIEDVLS